MEKRVFWVFGVMVLVVLLISNVSAEIIFNQPINPVYNLDDSVNIQVTVKTISSNSGNFWMYLICGGKSIDFYKNGVSLNAGEEKTMEASLILNKENIGTMTGNCVIKATYGSDYVLSDQFEISNSLMIQSKVEKIEFNPGESMIISGEVVKKNGNNANGFINYQFIVSNSSNLIEQLGTINNGYFLINVTLPKDLAAGAYLVKLDAYEINLEGEQRNTGYMNYNVNINQVPTSLEIFVENSEIEPGTVLRAKSILHDQTGEKMAATSILTVKKTNLDYVQQTEVPTDEYLEVEISYNEPPSTWTIVGVSSMLSAETQVIIKEKREILIELVNESIIITNKGNIPYNGSATLKIGENLRDIDIYLAVDESKEYKLSAPNGEYQIEVINDGKSKLRESVLLTGRVVDVKEAGSSNISLLKIIIWIFAFIVLCAVAFILYAKGYRRSLYGDSKKKHSSLIQNSQNETSKVQLKSLPITDLGNRAVLSLSIKGEKHEASMVCLRVRNLGEIGKDGIKDTMHKIESLADNRKVFIYENQESLFFIFSPVKTKTFANEKAAIQLAQDIKEALVNHNKIFKYKMDYGISVNTGYIVSKINSKGDLEFMGMGNILSNSKKIANLAHEEIFLSKEAKEKAGAMIKPEEKTIDGTKVYIIREMRDRDQYKPFIGAFLRNLERDEKERQERERRG